MNYQKNRIPWITKILNDDDNDAYVKRTLYITFLEDIFKLIILNE